MGIMEIKETLSNIFTRETLSRVFTRDTLSRIFTGETAMPIMRTTLGLYAVLNISLGLIDPKSAIISLLVMTSLFSARSAFDWGKKAFSFVSEPSENHPPNYRLD